MNDKHLILTELGIARQRLANQQLSGTTFTRPEEVVRHLGAVQAQGGGAHPPRRAQHHPQTEAEQDPTMPGAVHGAVNM